MSIPAAGGVVQDAHDTHDSLTNLRSAPPIRRPWLWPSAALLALAALFALGYLPKQQHRAALVQKLTAATLETPRVALTRPKRVEAGQALTLTGNIQGLEETIVYARTDGYVSRLQVDLGDRVVEGQVLAELDTPDTAQEIEQARGNLAQSEAVQLRAQAAREHSQANLRRYQALAAGLVSKEELDQKRTQASLDEADVHVAEASEHALLANLERLKLRQAFGTVRAPFAGTISARTVERGSLVSAGKASPLFRITRLDSVRIFVQVPQSRVPGVHGGLAARVNVAEYPNQVFEGAITRTAGVLEPSSRTMLVEVRVPNPDGRLMPGMYSSVTLALDDHAARLRVPATALIVGEKGVKVASVDAHGRVKFVPVEVERDLGAEIELASGLTGGEHVVVNPSPGLQDGSWVRAPE